MSTDLDEPEAKGETKEEEKAPPSEPSKPAPAPAEAKTAAPVASTRSPGLPDDDSPRRSWSPSMHGDSLHGEAEDDDDAGYAHGAEEPDEDLHDVQAPPASMEQIVRRKFLARVSIGMGAACGAALAVPMVGFVIAPHFKDEPLEWRRVGAVADFKIGETVGVTFMDASPLPWAGVTAKTAAWLRRVSEKEFIVFSVNCAHLGCPVRWLPEANLFMCPCHGGVYYADGTVAAGPPPHPLPRYAVRVTEGFVEIRTDPVPID